MPGPFLPRPRARCPLPDTAARRIAGLVLPLLAAPLLTACPGGESADGALPGESPAGSAALALPVSSLAGHAYLEFAHRQGFDPTGVSGVRLVRHDHPQGIVQAWLRGELSVAPLTTVEAVDICSRLPGRCPVLVLVLDESRGADQLLMRPAIPEIRDLRDRRVGLGRSSLGPWLLSRALKGAGLDIADVRIVPMEPQAMTSALRNGRIDAAVSTAPYNDLALQLGIARVAFDSRSLPGAIYDVLAVDPAFLARDRRQIVGLVRGWSRAHAWARRNPERAIAALAAQQEMSVPRFRRAEQLLAYPPLPEQRRLLAPGGPIAANVRALQEAQQEIGIVSRDAPLPAVSDGLVREVLQSAVSTSAPK